MRIVLHAIPVLLALATTATTAAAQTDPKFEYGKAEEVKAVEWKVSAQAGLILTTGNSRTTTGSIGGAADAAELPSATTPRSMSGTWPSRRAPLS